MTKKFEDCLDDLIEEQAIKGDLIRQIDLIKSVVRSEVDNAHDKIKSIAYKNDRLVEALTNYIKACNHASDAMLLHIKTKRRKTTELMDLYMLYSRIINEASSKVASVFSVDVNNEAES